MMFSIPTISPHELAQRLSDPEPPLLLDVREPEEWQAGFIPGAVLIPLGHLRERLPPPSLFRSSFYF